MRQAKGAGRVLTCAVFVLMASAASEGQITGVVELLPKESEYPEIVAVPAGSFMMGSSSGEEGRHDDEGPVHRVTIGTEDDRPMVLQYQAIDYRNAHEVSLVFRQDTVHLVVNTDFWQKETMPIRLGIFRTGYNSELSRLKGRLEYYHHYHMETVSMLEPVVPDAPVILIGDKEISIEHDHYEVLSGIIRSVWDHRWTCVHCTSYRIQGDSIVRIIRSSSPDVIDEFFKPSKIERFVEAPWISGGGESLDCIQIGNPDYVECLDSRFGTFRFELPMPTQDTSSASGP